MPAELQPDHLRTVQLVPLTAFDGNGRVNLEPMLELTRRLYDAGVRLFIPCAGSAEFHTLATEEIVAAVRMTRDVIGPDAKVIAPIGFRLPQAVALGQQALDAGADGVLVMPLAFPYLSDVGARDYYHALFDQLDCPALIYKKEVIPSDSLLLELADHLHVVGVKYAMNDIDAFNRIVQDDGGRMEWICGNAERFAPFFMLAGATGYTSGAGNLCPRVTLAMHRAIVAGQWDEAMRWQTVIRPIEDFRARSGSSFNISFLKHAIKLTGLDFGPPRAPQRQLSDQEAREIEAIVPPILDAERQLAESVKTLTDVVA